VSRLFAAANGRTHLLAAMAIITRRAHRASCHPASREMHNGPCMRRMRVSDVMSANEGWRSQAQRAWPVTRSNGITRQTGMRRHLSARPAAAGRPRPCALVVSQGTWRPRWPSVMMQTSAASLRAQGIRVPV
jgi:hypothetical protein